MIFRLLTLGVCATTTRMSLTVAADVNFKTTSDSNNKGDTGDFTSNNIRSLVDSSNFGCTCPGPFEKLPWVDDESKLGNTEVDTCNGHDDDNSWFTQLNFDESQSNPTMHYRYCERKLIRKKGGTCTKASSWGSDWIANYVSNSYEDTPTCGEWKKKTIPDKVNFRAFYDEGFFGWEDDYSCGSRKGSTYCYKTVGSPDHAALAYSSSGTVCFRYDLENCADVDFFCWGTSQDGCDYDSCETQCYTLTDPSKVHTLAFNSFGDTPVYYVEITFNNEEMKGNGLPGTTSAGSHYTMMRKSYLIIGLFAFVIYF